MDVDRLFTVREVAERLRVSSATVYALCDHGELAHVRRDLASRSGSGTGELDAPGKDASRSSASSLRVSWDARRLWG